MKKIGFIADTGGQVVKYEPQKAQPDHPAQPMTRHQRATIYFKALRYAETLLKEVGFRPVTLPSHGNFVLELGNFVLEMTTKEAPNVAYVTSYVGYEYDPKKINAKVVMACPVEPGEYVIRAIATLPNMRTLDPIYITVNKDADDILKDAFFNVIRTAHALIQKDPATMNRIREAMASRNLETDFERFRDQEARLTTGEMRQLPDKEV